MAAIIQTNGDSASIATNSLFKLKNADLQKEDSYVGGQWVTAKSGKRFTVLDPGSGKVWASCPDNSEEDVDAAVQSAQKAFDEYSKWTPRKRAQTIMKWHQLILDNWDDLATVLQHETGKPHAETQGELTYATGFTWWFQGEADRVAGTLARSAQPGRRVMTIKQPIGVAVALVPWNFPIAMILRKVGAAFAAGCTVVVKPSPETPITVTMLAALAKQAGFPDGSLNVLTTSLENTPKISETLILHPLIKKVSFTGSTRVGKIVTSLAARELKKVSLELGGNCPYIIFDDADYDQAISQLMVLKWRHAGQACITANRVYVQSGAYEKVAAEIVKRTSGLVVGHGTAKGTTLGPVTHPRGLDKTEELASDALNAGGKLLLGTGKRLQSGKGSQTNNENGSHNIAEGYFMEPTIIGEMNDKMALTSEEVFGPLLGLYKFETEEEVVKRANDTPMGLASYVFTQNSDRLWRMFEKLEAGMIGLNTGNSSSTEAPFGGIKYSGYGKESGKEVAVNEYMIEKTGTLTVQNLE